MHLVQVQEEIDGFDKRGADVIAVGQGTGDEAGRFAEKWGVGLPILGDPSGRAYHAYGMLKGNLWSVVLRGMVTRPIESMLAIAKADFAGATLASSDVMRLGGVAIIAGDGRMRFLHRAEEPADIPSNAEVFAALETL